MGITKRNLLEAFVSLPSLRSNRLSRVHYMVYFRIKSFHLQPPFQEMSANEDVADTTKSLGSSEECARELIFAGIPARALRKG